jgi:mono/diheme cytochrome c family protein
LYKSLKEIRKAALLAAAVVVSSPSAYADPGRTVNDHVFSAGQALRGQQAFRKNCASACHLITMTGGERVPGLAGEAFMLRWNGQTVADLYERIQSTMPQTAPRSLTPQSYIDIVAYILSANGLPAGTTELPPDPGSLKTIKFVDPSETN